MPNLVGHPDTGCAASRARVRPRFPRTPATNADPSRTRQGGLRSRSPRRLGDAPPARRFSGQACRPRDDESLRKDTCSGQDDPENLEGPDAPGIAEHEEERSAQDQRMIQEQRAPDDSQDWLRLARRNRRGPGQNPGVLRRPLRPAHAPTSGVASWLRWHQARFAAVPRWGGLVPTREAEGEVQSFPAGKKSSEAAREDRTPDLLITNQPLYRLSYGGTQRVFTVSGP